MKKTIVTIMVLFLLSGITYFHLIGCENNNSSSEITSEETAQPKEPGESSGNKDKKTGTVILDLEID